MKKLLVVIISIISVLTLCGCEKKQKEEPIQPIKPFDLNEIYYEKASFEEIDSKKLIELQETEESFVVYVYLPGCLSCASFKEVLKEFHKDNNLVIYSLKTEEMKKTNINEYVTYAPSFVIFKEGKKVAFLDATSDDDKEVYETKDNFKKWLTKYINLKEKDLN